MLNRRFSMFSFFESKNNTKDKQTSTRDLPRRKRSKKSKPSDKFAKSELGKIMTKLRTLFPLSENFLVKKGSLDLSYSGHIRVLEELTAEQLEGLDCFSVLLGKSDPFCHPEIQQSLRYRTSPFSETELDELYNMIEDLDRSRNEKRFYNQNIDTIIDKEGYFVAAEFKKCRKDYYVEFKPNTQAARDYEGKLAKLNEEVTGAEYTRQLFSSVKL